MRKTLLFSRQLLVTVLLLIGTTAWGDCTPDAINIAKCKSYTLEPEANYPGGDKSTDATDLTDGIFVGAYHTDPGTIGWREYPGVRITTNLNKPGCSEANHSACASISEIKLDIKDGAHPSEIWCPLKVRFEVSDDGVNYFQVATVQPPVSETSLN